MNLKNIDRHITILKNMPIPIGKKKAKRSSNNLKLKSKKVSTAKVKELEIIIKRDLAQVVPGLRPVIRLPLKITGPRNAFPMTKVDGVFEGGGALGTAYIGSLRAIWDNNIWFDRLAGTSAGAIIAALVAAGYTIDELEYLTAPQGLVPKPATLGNNINPIDFRQLMDFAVSASQIDSVTKENSILWQALNLTVYDTLLNVPLPIPTKKSIKDSILRLVPDIPGINEHDIFDSLIQGVLDPIAAIPVRTIYAKDLLPSFAKERKSIADKLWDDFATLNPHYVLLLNYMAKGGLCKGDHLLSIVEKLVHHKTGKVNAKISELKFELALIATDANTKSRIIYSAKENDIAVAEAVRRSMSIPVVYNPRIDARTHHEIMDGGICDNFPFWIFSDAGARYFNTGRTASKKIIGFLLNEEKSISHSVDVNPAKFRDKSGSARVPGDIEGLIQNTGLPLQIDSNHNPTTENKLLERELRKISLVQARAGMSLDILQSTIIPALYGPDFLLVEVPMKGYSWLDFTVNTDAENYLGMLQRGWHATMAAIKTPAAGFPISNDTVPYQ